MARNGAPILSLRDLAARLGISVVRLEKIADEIAQDMHSHYAVDVRKIGHKVRNLRVPRPELKSIQRRINANILGRVPLNAAAHGGVRGRSPRTNAIPHLGQPCVINLDVKDFFPSVRHDLVLTMLRRRGFGRDVARLLTRLTTVDGQLPQGAPTSTAIANLLLDEIDGDISERAEHCQVRYTRFVDDITLSGLNPRPLIGVAASLLSRKGLRVHRPGADSRRAKLRIQARGSTQVVTGLTVNSGQAPSVSKVRRDDVRAAIFALLRESNEKIKLRANSARGQIAHVRQFNSGSAKRLQRYLELTLSRRSTAEHG